MDGIFAPTYMLDNYKYYSQLSYVSKGGRKFVPKGVVNFAQQPGVDPPDPIPCSRMYVLNTGLKSICSQIMDGFMQYIQILV